MQTIKPQRGPQEDFLSSAADIVIYGGGAGGGKTWGLLLEPLRHVHNPDFGAVFFRRNSTQIRNEGGLWDESMKLYQPLGADPKESTLDWTFSSGASISFRHLEHEKTKFDWQGSQIPLICFDELTHFSEGQFWYLLTRNRSMCGVRPYVRATCNPDPDSWVAQFISWWIDQDTGYPIPERAGKLRYFVRVGDSIIWADSPEELAHYTQPDENGNERPIPPKSATFIPALLTDNRALMAADPGYMATLMALSTVERERLLGGNWKIRQSGGLFQREWFSVKDPQDLPSPVKRLVRGWDLAGTEEKTAKEGAANSGPAYTAGALLAELENGQFAVMDMRRDRLSPMGTERLIMVTAAKDANQYGSRVSGSLPQDPGQAGKFQGQYLVAKLAGHNYRASPESGDKVTRALPFSAQAEAGNVFVVRGPWNEAMFSELEAFPQGKFKDQIDALSRAFQTLSTPVGYEFDLGAL